MEQEVRDFIVAEVAQRALAEPDVPLRNIMLDAIEEALILYGALVFDTQGAA